MLPSFIVSSVLLVSPAFAASASDWATKAVYQLVTDRFATSNDSSTSCDTSDRTYCGGSWVGIANHLDYIQELGFDAVWISPIVENVDGTAYGDGYHGYWSRDITTVSTRFGSTDDLKKLSAALHTRGMYLMLDVVINHFAAIPTNKSVTSNGQFTFDYSLLEPLNTVADFHPQCFITDYANQTDNDTIVTTMNAWIKDVVAAYDVDGVRIDTVKHIRKDFWSPFASSAGVFTLGEVLTDNATYASNYIGAVDAVLEYPAYYALITAFGSTSGNLSALQASPHLAPASGSVTSASFLENHDQPRFASYTQDIALTKNAMAWPFVGDGMPILYYGQEQGYAGGADPSNREALWLSGYETGKPLVAHVKSLNAARKLAIAGNSSFLSGGAAWVTQSNPSTLMLSKPPLLTLLTNVGASATTQPTWSIPAGLYAANTTLVDVLACTALTVDGTGAATTVAAGSACPALAVGGSGSSGAPRGRTVRALAVLGAVVGVLFLI
ncbi:glycoside hydrolase superfamily [Mycena sp. CBHHK59/15]|nr:glycoside hydrolase superfamily [Mycena sp. CBHHK59/15]